MFSSQRAVVGVPASVPSSVQHLHPAAAACHRPSGFRLSLTGDMAAFVHQRRATPHRVAREESAQGLLWVRSLLPARPPCFTSHDRPCPSTTG
eukprot:633048-Hanusia_phi.AAC.4